MRNKSMLMLVGILFLSACSGSREKNRDEYILWMKEHGKQLTRTQEKGGRKFSVRYEPSELLVLREYGNGISEEEFQAHMKTADESVSFVMRIHYDDPKENPVSGDNLQSPGYGFALNYLSIDAVYDMALVSGKDTLPCTYYQYEPNYGAAPYTTILLAFENPFKGKKEPDADMTFCFDDHLHNSGLLKFIYTKEELKKIPITR